jgi:nitroimidazol reductase NimA-like FMN-containing flavoprotein (pyridoxamine 5'-phosphate oxidase superfamily)
MQQTVPATVEEMLTGEKTVAHLATSVDNRPHSAPLWYRYGDGTIEILTTGQKLANIRQNPRVSLSIQHADEGIPEWEVTILGTATVVDDDEKAREANRKLNRKYGVDDNSWDENTLVRIDVGSVTYTEW